MKTVKNLKLTIIVVLLAAAGFGGYYYYQRQHATNQMTAVETSEV